MHMVLLDAGESSAGVFDWSTLLIFVPMIALIYFLMIRPESKRKKKAQKMREELVVGDEITTIGGIVGRVINIKDDDLVIETGHDRSQIKIKKWAMSSREEKIKD